MPSTDEKDLVCPPTNRGASLQKRKIGPFHGGIGVAVWLNTIDAGDGSKRQVRSITIAPRRYFDRDSNQWKDAPSYNPSDLPALIFALQKAQEYCYTTPMAGEEVPVDSGDIPF